MALVHLFRILTLFLNVYETFKILKSPPPSARKGGQPSIRAVTQRKRDMKGCLAVWIVWCCFATYERTFDIVISRLVPFYDEFKSLILIFLIVTRAKGAEPIFLHILRPIIKPYTSTLDSLLDLTRMVGDVLCLLAAVPLHFALSWGHSLFLRNDDPLEEISHHPKAHETDIDSLRNPAYLDLASFPPAVEPQAIARMVPTQCQPDMQRSVQSRHPSVNIAQGTVQTKRQVFVSGGGQSCVINQVSTTSSQHQIWHPPQSSCEPTKEAQEIPACVPLFVDSHATSEEPADEWRQYLPFPSAYPPTPLPPTSHLSLPHSSADPSAPSPRRTFHFPSLPTISDVQQQDFARSLLPPRKPLSPGFLDGSSSDNSSSSGIQDQGRNANVRSDGAVLGFSDMDDEEHEDTDDDFDVTLRTPHPAMAASRVTARPKAESVTSTSKSSAPSRSTALTTVDNGSSLRTRTSSESSVPISISDSSSVASSSAGQKRPFPREQTVNARHTSKVWENGTLKDVRTAVKRPSTRRVPSHIVTRSQQRIVRDLTTTDSLDDEDSDRGSGNGEAWVDRIAPGQKRRRMVGPTRGPSVYSTRTKITPQERSTLQRMSSSRSTVSAEAPPVASRASSRLSRRAMDPTTDASHAVESTVGAPRRASDKNRTRRRR